jgi:hypothetical protein
MNSPAKLKAPPRHRALTYLAYGHIRAALAVIALRFLRTSWLAYPLSFLLALIIYLYAIRPLMSLIFP